MPTSPLSFPLIRQAFRRALATLPLAAMVLSPLARAQEAEAPPVASAETAPVETTPLVPGEMLPDGSYVVKKGDTLWDLSQQFLQNPWYWPKIWAENPEIENPHWIYPGNRLRVKGGGEGAPAEVSPVDEDQPQEPGDEPLPARRRDVADFSVGNINSADNLGAGDDLVSIAGEKIGLNNGRVGAQIPGIIRAKDAEALGEIVSSFEPKEMLCSNDRAFVKMKDAGRVRVGDRMAIVRDRDDVHHPTDGRLLGKYSELIGGLRIVRKDGDQVVGVIEACRYEISRGDKLVPGRAEFKPVERKESTKKLEGMIVYTAYSKQVLLGENSVIFIDRGTKDGVADGNIFTVYQQGDGLKRIKHETTSAKDEIREAVGQLIIVDAGETTSAAIVVQSVRDITVGDRIELGLPAGSSGDAP